MLGYTFTDSSHNVFSINEPPPLNIHTRRGAYDYSYESTAGFGETVFWKYTKNFIQATGSTQCH
jgi:hypothetical protein